MQDSYRNHIREYNKDKLDSGKRKMNDVTHDLEINDVNEISMEDNILNEVVKLKNDLEKALIENKELKNKCNEDRKRLDLLSLKNNSLLNEICEEKEMLKIEYNNYKMESVKDIKRLQDELDKNVIMLNCLKDEILFKEEELRKAEIIERLYKQESELNEEKDMKIKKLENLLNQEIYLKNDKEEKDKINKEEINEKLQLLNNDLDKKNEELNILNKKYDNLKKTNIDIQKKICFLKEEIDYYKNNENSFIMQNIFNAENNLDDSIFKKNFMKISVLYNVLFKIVVYDQRNLFEKEKILYSLEKENTHFLKKIVADEIYCLYLKDCISKINLTYQIDLHKQEKKYMLLNSEYDELYNKFIEEKKENLLLNETYDKIIFNQKSEINKLKSHISIQNKDKEILTKYIDNYITYIEDSYQKYCILNKEYKNLEEMHHDLEEKNKSLIILVNRMEDKYPIENNNNNNINELHMDHIKIMKNNLKDKDIKIFELQNKNLELIKTIDKLNDDILKKNTNKEYIEVESGKMKDLCFDLKDICSKLELEIKEKNFIIDDLTDKLNQSEKKNKDNQVILELSEFRIQNFNDNVKYFTSKVNELNDKFSFS